MVTQHLTRPADAFDGDPSTPVLLRLRDVTIAKRADHAGRGASEADAGDDS